MHSSLVSLACAAGAPLVTGNRLSGLVALLLENIAAALDYSVFTSGSIGGIIRGTGFDFIGRGD